MTGQSAVLAAAIPLLALLLVLALRREARLAPTRRAARARRLQMARLTGSLERLGDAMRSMAPAAARAAASMTAFGDALDRVTLVHRTAARPAHRAARGER